MNKPRLEVEYCIRCGFMMRAAWIAQELLKSFEHELGEAALKPGSGGIFTIRLDERLLFSNQASGRFPEVREIKQLMAQALGSERRCGHETPGPGA